MLKIQQTDEEVLINCLGAFDWFPPLTCSGDRKCREVRDLKVNVFTMYFDSDVGSYSFPIKW